MCVRKWFVTASIVVVALAAGPRTASADWTITPFVGWNFGGSADVNRKRRTAPPGKFETKWITACRSPEWATAPVGFELDFGYSPNFFETSTTSSGIRFTSDSNVTTLMGNLVIAGARRIGAAICRRRSRTHPDQRSGLRRGVLGHSKNDFGMDIGGGVMGFFSDNVGLRGDVRYFRGFRGTATRQCRGDRAERFQVLARLTRRVVQVLTRLRARPGGVEETRARPRSRCARWLPRTPMPPRASRPSRRSRSARIAWNRWY